MTAVAFMRAISVLTLVNTASWLPPTTDGSLALALAQIQIQIQ